MGGVSQLSSELRTLPDQALQHELQQPSGLVPPYLVLAEAQRRQLLRQAAQQDQSKQQSSTVLQDVVRNMNAQLPPPGASPVGMTPGRQGQGPAPGASPPTAMPTPTPPQNPPGMAKGGPLKFAAGGEVSPDDIDGWINQYSQQYGVDPDMARSIMAQESNGDPNAMGPPTRNGQRAIGLFQLMPGTAAQLGVKPTIPEENIKGGIQYYGQLLKQFNGDPQLALAAYNAGPGAVQHYGGVPPFEQTQNYVPAIMGRYAKRKENQLAQQPAAAQPQAAAGQPAPPTAAPDLNTALQNAGIGALPDIHPPAAPDQPLDAGAAYAVNNRQPGRIHQLLDDQGKVIADITARLQPRSADNPNGLIDPYGDENVAAMRRIAPSLFGVPADYLDNLSRNADTRAATINQLQGEILNRYHNPSPWEFLSNIAAGMGASKSLNLANAFGEGVGMATQQRDQQQQQAIQDYDALEKMREGIYGNVETERGRMGQTLAGLLEHQAGITDASRKTLEDQLAKATAQQDKLKQMLIPTNKMEPMYNRADFGDEAADASLKAWQQTHNASPKQVEQELTAIQMLSQRGDPFVQGGPYATAAEQFTKKYPTEAASLLNPPVGDLDKSLIQNTYLTNRQFVDGRNYHGKRADMIQAQTEKLPGVTYLGKDQAESLDNIEDSQRGFDSMEKSMLANLPRDPAGHVITENLKLPLTKITQFDPVLSSWGAWRANAIAQLRAAAGSKGLRINSAEIQSAIENDIPSPADTVGTAMRKLAIMRRTIQNQEDTLFHTRGKETPAADIPMLGSDKKTMYYVPADQWKKYVDQGYSMLK